ncbi:hypothetical protein ACOSQ3_024826 [Xanthoceras sorbifolium]
MDWNLSIHEKEQKRLLGLRSRNSDAEGSTVGKLEEFESDREEVKGAGEVEIQQMGSVYVTDQVENSGLNTEKREKAIVPVFEETLKTTALVNNHSGVMVGKDVGSDGADLTVVSSRRRRSWKRLARNQAIGVSTERVQLGKRAINLDADEDG